MLYPCWSIPGNVTDGAEACPGVSQKSKMNDGECSKFKFTLVFYLFIFIFYPDLTFVLNNLT